LAATIQRRSFIRSLLWTKEQKWSFPSECCRFSLPVSFHQCYVLIQTLCCVILSVDIVVIQHTENPYVKSFMSDT